MSEVLDDDTDYDYEALMDFHGIITDNYLSQFTNGEPNSTALIYEQIIDLFHARF